MAADISIKHTGKSASGWASKSDITNLENRVARYLDPIEGLLKTLAGPASKVGLTPAQFLNQRLGGAPGGMVGGDGTVSFPASRSKGCGMGEMLEDMYFVAGGRDHPQKAANGATIEKAQKRLFSPSERGGYAVTKAALAESSGITGGYTVPPMFSNQLQMLAIEESIVYNRATRFPMTALNLLIPTLDQTSTHAAGVTPFLGGVVASWTAEAATRNESEPQFRQMELKAWELSFYTVASNTLLADNAVGLDSLLTQLFSMAISWYTDFAYIQGNGVGKPMGILNAPATISVQRSASSKFTYVDATVMLSKLWMMLWRGTKVAWVAHPSVLPQLLQMNDASGTTAGTGRVLYVPLSEGAQTALGNSAGTQSAGYLFGHPVIFSEKMQYLGTAGDVMLCDFSKYILGERAELAIDVSPHVKFLNNQMVWRVLWRGDGQPWLNNPITLQDNTATSVVSPFVKLGAP